MEYISNKHGPDAWLLSRWLLQSGDGFGQKGLVMVSDDNNNATIKRLLGLLGQGKDVN